ncbi:MAG: methyltransferase domain-containing protein [Phycisphaeraceae bacterium]|nr:methyltransferase domain-containing protein [Phycisphaeraceae bacterium]
MHALDLGCGTGRHALWLAAEGATVTALDFSDGMLDQARKSRIDRIRFHTTSTPPSPSPPSSTSSSAASCWASPWLDHFFSGGPPPSSARARRDLRHAPRHVPPGELRPASRIKPRAKSSCRAASPTPSVTSSWPRIVLVSPSRALPSTPPMPTATDFPDAAKYARLADARRDVTLDLIPDPMPSTPRSTFLGRPGALVGMVHVHALPGTPGSSLSPDQLVRRARCRCPAFTYAPASTPSSSRTCTIASSTGPSRRVVAVNDARPLAIRELDARIRLSIRFSQGETPMPSPSPPRHWRVLHPLRELRLRASPTRAFSPPPGRPLLHYRRSIGADHVKICCDIKKSTPPRPRGPLPRRCRPRCRVLQRRRPDRHGAATGRPTSPATWPKSAPHPISAPRRLGCDPR